jgi:hypothetical protein
MYVELPLSRKADRLRVLLAAEIERAAKLRSASASLIQRAASVYGTSWDSLTPTSREHHSRRRSACVTSDGC